MFGYCCIPSVTEIFYCTLYRGPGAGGGLLYSTVLPVFCVIGQCMCKRGKLKIKMEKSKSESRVQLYTVLVTVIDAHAHLNERLALGLL